MKKNKCACGCEETFPKSRIETVTINHVVHRVARGHRCKMAREINLSLKMEKTIRWLATQPYGVRRQWAGTIYQAQLDLRTRLQGEDVAKKIARHSWWMLVTPRPIANFLGW